MVFMNCLVPFVGPSIGLSAGCLVNGAYHRSIIKKGTIHSLGPFERISTFCESLRFKANGPLDALKMLALSEFLPLAVAMIEEVGKQWVASVSFKQSLLRGGVFIVKTISLSWKHTIPLLYLAIIAIAIVKRKFRGSSCDPSGHAITVCWNTMIRYNTLVAIKSLGGYSFTYLAFTGLMSCAEGIWMYDTTVNFHSIVDMVSGVAISALSIAFHSACGPMGVAIIIASHLVAVKVFYFQLI